jgi:putative oxidoreductase
MSLTLLIIYLGRFLLGAAFVVFGLRNVAAIPRLTEAMEKKGVPQARALMTTGVGIQIVAAFLFHAFWEYPTAERTPHINAFVMNTGLAGAFLVAAAVSL